MRLPLQNQITPGNPAMAFGNALAGLQQQQALGQNAQQIQQAKIASMYMSPAATVLGNPYLTSFLSQDAKNALVNAVVGHLQGGAGQNAMMGGNGLGSNMGGASSQMGSSGGMPGSNTSLQGGPSTVAPSSSGIQGGAQAKISSLQNPALISSGQNNIAQIKNLVAQLGSPNQPGSLANQISQVGRTGNILGEVTDIKTPALKNALQAISVLNKNYGNLLGGNVGLSTLESGPELVNRLTTAVNALKQGYSKQQIQNILAGQQGVTSTPADNNQQQNQNGSQSAEQSGSVPALNLNDADMKTVQGLNLNTAQGDSLSKGQAIRIGNRFWKIIDGRLHYKDLSNGK